MSGGHAHGLFVHGSSPVHRLAPQCKLAAAFLFVIAVVVTPREAFTAFVVYAAAVGFVTKLAGVRLRFVVRRLLIELPFLLFLLFLPFIAGGEMTRVLGLELSIEGLWAAWNIAIKSTLGLATTVLLGATTPVADLLRGLDRLHTPRIITAIAGFMVRYTDVVTGEMRRMKIARESRGYNPRWFWQARALASSAGSLFIRSFERGERVHTSMLSRGFDGALPSMGHTSDATSAQWFASLVLPVAAGLVAAAALVLR